MADIVTSESDVAKNKNWNDMTSLSVDYGIAELESFSTVVAARIQEVTKTKTHPSKVHLKKHNSYP